MVMWCAMQRAATAGLEYHETARCMLASVPTMRRDSTMEAYVSPRIHCWRALLEVGLESMAVCGLRVAAEHSGQDIVRGEAVDVWVRPIIG